MAGGIITKIALGTSTTDVEEDFYGFYHNLSMTAGQENRFDAKNTNHGNPKDPPPVGKYFVKGWWTDEKDKPIKEALIGQKVKFHVQMDKSKVPANSKVNFILKDWDGMLNQNDPITLYSTVKNPKTNAYPEINELVTDANGKASLAVTLTDGLVQFIEDDGENEIELYFDCNYYDLSDKEREIEDLPEAESDYLIVYEKEVLITVLVELPHSSYSLFKKGQFVSAIGLEGHSAMAIGERYFDYGPNNQPGIYNEKKYDYDFNDDGDKDDDVDLISPNYMNAPGRPWWGEMVADNLAINAEDVKLQQVFDFLKLDWKLTNIYGEVHKIEFYVKESEAKRMLKWWEERYKHLKIYSVFPWTGEQCTTAVKTAIQDGYPFKFGKVINQISDDTQRPAGLLSELKKFVSSSKQHFNNPANNIILKPEEKTFVPSP